MLLLRYTFDEHIASVFLWYYWWVFAWPNEKICLSRRMYFNIKFDATTSHDHWYEPERCATLTFYDVFCHRWKAAVTGILTPPLHRHMLRAPSIYFYKNLFISIFFRRHQRRGITQKKNHQLSTHWNPSINRLFLTHIHAVKWEQ